MSSPTLPMMRCLWAESDPLSRMRRSPVHLAIHRFDDSVYSRRIDREAFLLLSAIRDGECIATAIAAALSESSGTPQEQAFRIRDYFAHASELGWFTTGPPR
jgi:hypothetical protein